MPQQTESGPSRRSDGRELAHPTPASDPGHAMREAILGKIRYAAGRDVEAARDHDWYLATALAVRDRIVDIWLDSIRRTTADQKQVAYFSLEFLIGRLLGDALSNLDLVGEVRDALAGLGVDYERVKFAEADAALGNGGLGRLAACFMESMASLDLPAYGYGIRYDYGLFRQVLTDGWQHEIPEDWLSFGNPWEFERPNIAYPIHFGGSVEMQGQPGGLIRHAWHHGETVMAVAFDTPVVGWRGKRVNTLRLWSARSVDPLKLEAFNHGDYVGAMAERANVEAISRVLYPSDATPAGQELRLRQEYFFTSASLQDLLRRHLERHPDLTNLADRAAIQLNDTHPAIAVAELMRLLVDERGLAWDEAWRITTGTLNYTNHTLLPEALESWPTGLMERLLPRHMQIIYLINWLHLEKLAEDRPLTDDLIKRVSLIDEDSGRRVRMGHLAFLGSHRVNGVSALHTDLMRETVFRDLHALYPDRICNKTNGITFRRWLHQANPGLTELLVEAVGPAVLDDPGALSAFQRLADDAGYRERLQAVRRRNKLALAREIKERLAIDVDPDAMFDVQIKRIHEYKRQLLNLIETAALYEAIKLEPELDWAPRVKIFAGKAASSYHQAKLIIKFAYDLAQKVNNDPAMKGRLAVAFMPNYNVSLAELIIPAADLSEQISTAGMEASGTGNMKLALNGALTVGTLDGANVEIRERVGPDNIAIFGLTAPEVAERRADAHHGRNAIANSPRLASVLYAMRGGAFSPDERSRYAGLVQGLSDHDTFMVTDDFDSYWDAQRGLDRLWAEPRSWWRQSAVNTARIGWFSSDRTIRDYAEEIWRVPVA
ncbi:glycogen/starch/alpha-glucan phosphorylase [Enterovirga sp.]|jgi:starch phosphorylase|uniref:glycogen/starch/alpha-glucan phosphorylase n=1 Tax=Enterovirga sp. TaxID=2026350 RepID=UPI002626A6C2|nr:glycogen/starch/alpha-glucan phosphorylase [Enterovirga sp.]MDB5591265.1 glycogen/starch/alpha-glucan phosphorylase [Enterovirga sp.]